MSPPVSPAQVTAPSATHGVSFAGGGGAAPVNGDARAVVPQAGAGENGADVVPEASGGQSGGGESLKDRAKWASFWTTFGYGAMQVLRFGSSLVLTRLLAPDVFGLMTLASVFLQALQMFSDIGIGPAIIQNKRGGTPEFLNTAWTMQIIRGQLLFLAACAGAYPMAVYYEEPALLWLIPLLGLSSSISGFDSTAVGLLSRQIRLREITLLGLAEQLLNYGVIVIWALFHPSVWALIAGTTASEVFRAVSSHYLVPSMRNRWHWNREDARSMFRFGRWIFISTALTFFAMQLDKLMLAKMLGTDTLGVYGVAFALGIMAPQLLKRLGGQIAFPALSEIVRDRPHMLYSRLLRVRLAMAGLSVLMLVPLVLIGDVLVEFLYDSRYHDAGWMLQILAIGALVNVVNATYNAALFAQGKTFHSMMLLATQIALMAGAAVIGHAYYGELGFIVGVASVDVLNYPFVAAIMIRSRLWQPHLDAALMAVAAGAAAGAYLLL